MWVDSDYIELARKSMSNNQRVYMGCDVEVVNGSESVERYNANYAFRLNDSLITTSSRQLAASSSEGVCSIWSEHLILG